MYTQPKLYAKITTHPDTLSVYGKQLLDEGTCAAEALDDIKTMVNRTLEADFQAAKTWEVQTHTHTHTYIHTNRLTGSTLIDLIVLSCVVFVSFLDGRRPSTTGSRPRSG